jgi:hypothetical protein
MDRLLSSSICSGVQDGEYMLYRLKVPMVHAAACCSTATGSSDCSAAAVAAAGVVGVRASTAAQTSAAKTAKRISVRAKSCSIMLAMDETGGRSEDCCASTELLAKTAQRDGGSKACRRYNTLRSEGVEQCM